MNNLGDLFEKRIAHAIKAANFVVGRINSKGKRIWQRDFLGAT